MKRSKEGRSREPHDGATSPENISKRLLGSSPPSPSRASTLDRPPSLSLSTASLQSASTATPRSHIQRRLSRPKWLDVDDNGGLLKRKADPATASVTIKGADSIGLARMRRADSDSLPGNGEPSRVWTKPHIRKAVTLDTVSSPRQTPVTSPRRRVSPSPRSPAFDRIAGEEPDQRMEGEDGVVRDDDLPGTPLIGITDESCMSLVYTCNAPGS